MLKKIGSEAREDMQDYFGCKVNMQIWVKVKEDWRNRARFFRISAMTKRILTDNPIKSDSGTRFDTMSDFS